MHSQGSQVWAESDLLIYSMNVHYWPHPGALLGTGWKDEKWSLSQCHRKEMTVRQLSHYTTRGRRSKSRVLLSPKDRGLWPSRNGQREAGSSLRWCCSCILKEIKGREKLGEAEACGRSNRNSKRNDLNWKCDYSIEASVTKTMQKIARRTLPLLHVLCASWAVQLLYATRLLLMRTVCQPKIWPNSCFLEARDMLYIL